MKTFKSILLLILIGVLFGVGTYAKAHFSWQTEYAPNNTYSGLWIMFTFWPASAILDYLISNKLELRLNPISTFNNKYITQLKEELGEREYQILFFKSAFRALSILGISIFILIKGFDLYEKNQITKHGSKTMVSILETRQGPKGSTMALFEYSFNGLTYQKELFLKDKDPKSQHQVIFSTENPKIIKWIE